MKIICIIILAVVVSLRVVFFFVTACCAHVHACKIFLLDLFVLQDKFCIAYISLLLY